MAYRSEEAIRRSQEQSDFERTKHGVENLPPGFIEGFRPILLPELRVVIDPGIANVQGYRVQTREYTLRERDFLHGQNGGDEGLTYYVYLNREGQYSAELIEPQYSESRFYFQHPVTEARAILRLFVDSNDDIIFASRQFSDTKDVWVASSEYVGEADYYCSGLDDQHVINAAITYISRNDGKVNLTAGVYNISNEIVAKSKIAIFGTGNDTVIRKNSSSHAISIKGESNNKLSSVYIAFIKIVALDSISSYNLINAEYVDSITIENISLHDSQNIGLNIKNSERVTIQNLFVTGSKSRGLNIDGSEDVFISNSNSKENAISLQDDILDAHGFYIANVTGRVVATNIISSKNDLGIRIENCEDLVLLGPVVFECEGAGIQIANLSGAIINGAFVKNNGGNGIEVSEKISETSIVGSVISDNKNNGILVTGTPGTPENPDLADPSRYNVISGNAILRNGSFGLFSNSGSGIVLGVESDDNTVSGNTIIGNVEYGISVGASNCDNNVIVGNRITANIEGQISDNGTNTFFQTNTDSDDLNSIITDTVREVSDYISIAENTTLSIGP